MQRRSTEAKSHFAKGQTVVFHITMVDYLVSDRIPEKSYLKLPTPNILVLVA